MTPQDIFEYKLRWHPGHEARVHSDLDIQAKTWCRRNLERHQWAVATYTDVYEHTFMFEHIHSAKLFAQEFNLTLDY